MSEIKSGLKSINNLLEYNYLIPSYQRGYRWTKSQVTDLLDDIWEFSQKEKKKGEFYCLQPIVVSKVGEDEYAVIDGQQRLTTILIILRTLEEEMKLIFRSKRIFQIDYKTRNHSREFLEKIDHSKKRENIDYYHICEAQIAILDWFAKHSDAKVDFLNTLLKDDLKSPESVNNVRVIWYEPGAGVNHIEVFTRLNMGKIGLTNAELIKALFLSSTYSMTEEDAEKLVHRRKEIAAEWDRYENMLRDEEFWGFLQNNVIDYENHIEFIFDLIAKNLKKDGTRMDSDKYKTFRFFCEAIQTVSEAWEIWDENVKATYQLLHDWYTDRKLFHLIGFLIASGEMLGDLISGASKLTKSEQLGYIRKLINEKIPENINQLTYQEEKAQLRRVLLLFNVLSILENPFSNIRFQFGRYKKEKWDIEHIHSVKSEMPESKAHQLDWLKEVLKFSTGKEEELVDDINRYLSSPQKDKENFEELYNRVWQRFSEEADEKSQDRDVNDISNLTLLDQKTNRQYKNAIFPIKRNVIIDKDQSGTFVPLCTKNVFLKYYSRDVNQNTFWGRDDRQGYRNALIGVIDSYLTGKNYE